MFFCNVNNSVHRMYSERYQIFSTQIIDIVLFDIVDRINVSTLESEMR